MLINFSATTRINFGQVKIEEESQKVKVEEGDMEWWLQKGNVEEDEEGLLEEEVGELFW